MSKYLISVDIEGITGVATKEFSKEGGRHYSLACKYMASDVNAVIQGILTVDDNAEILVRDAHGTASNLNLELLHPKAQVVQGWDAGQNMLTSLDESFSGVFLVGYHAGGQNLDAVLAHTMSSIVKTLKINGKVVNEAGLFAHYAGYYDVPVGFISGDNFTITEASEQISHELVGVITKQSYGRSCAASLSLELAKHKLRDGATIATIKFQQKALTPIKIAGTVHLELGFYDSGVRVSAFRNLTKLLEHDSNYSFDLQNESLVFNSKNMIEAMQKLSLIFFVIYGIRGIS